MTDIHSCSYYCDRPECVKAQRDDLRAVNERLLTENEELEAENCSRCLCRLDPEGLTLIECAGHLFDRQERDRLKAENERLRAALVDILESHDPRWGYSDSVTTIARAALKPPGEKP